jgi:hypothetical protein
MAAVVRRLVLVGAGRECYWPIPMKPFLHLLAVVFILAGAAPLSHAAPPPKESTDFEGSIKAISATSITVQGPKGTKVFRIYPGTVFGQRAAKQLSDFTVNEKVRVVFSEAAGKAQAENIRNPDEDKKPGAKKAKAGKNNK